MAERGKMSITVDEVWVKEQRAKARQVKDQYSELQPLRVGQCPFCNKHVSIWLNSKNLETFDVCSWCNNPILWDVGRALSDEEMANYGLGYKVVIPPLPRKEGLT